MKFCLVAEMLRLFSPILEKVIINSHFGNEFEDEGNDNDSILAMDSKLFEIEDLKLLAQNKNYQFRYAALHLNIHSLPEKHDQLKNMLTRLNDISMPIHFILLCETFLTENNIPGFIFICKNRESNSCGGVAIYIKECIKFVRRSDLEVHFDGEFESLVIEATCNENKCYCGRNISHPEHQ
jgi:hypothetical protein